MFEQFDKITSFLPKYSYKTVFYIDNNVILIIKHYSAIVLLVPKYLLSERANGKFILQIRYWEEPQGNTKKVTFKYVYMIRSVPIYVELNFV